MPALRIPLFLALLLSAFSAVNATSYCHVKAGCDPAPWSRIEMGSQTGYAAVEDPVFGAQVHAPAGLVIDTQAEWDDFWTRHQSISSPPAPAPAVDFATEWVAVVLDGEHSYSPFRIEVLDVSYDVHAQTYFVTYDTAGPCPPARLIKNLVCYVLPAFTQPYDIVRVDRVGPGAPVALFLERVDDNMGTG